MESGIDYAIIGSQIAEKQLDVIAHNLANAGTQGYKEERLSFDKILLQQAGQSAGDNANDTPLANQNVLRTVSLAPGALMTTNNPLDIAIQGDGLFEIQTAQGSRYTRNGAFVLNEANELVTQSGDKVAGQSGTIQVPAGVERIEIGGNGSVMADGNEIGRLKIVQFDHPSALTPAGGTLLQAESDNPAKEASESTVVQGKLESSNVNMTLNLVKLIEVSRQYEAYQKAIQNQARISEQTSQSMGRLG